MPICRIKDCKNKTRYENTVEKYCAMHNERIARHGYPELKKERGEHGLEKLPHKIIDDFIRKNGEEMIDKEIVLKLKSMGYTYANRWNIGYRRRKLGGRKYLRGEIKKHKAWVRSQAIKKYGKLCELCGYNMTIDTHHIIPKYQGGPHDIENLMVICPNCHGLITRGFLTLKNRSDIPKIRRKVLRSLKRFYTFL